MPRLHFRLPGRADTLGVWLASLFPDLDRSTRRRWVVESRVRVEARVADRLGSECPPGARVEIVDVSAEDWPGLAAGSHRGWMGIIDEPPWRGGSLALDDDHAIEFRVIECRDGLARIRFDGDACDAQTLARVLARAGMPLVGDLERGGLGIAGGVRLVATDESDSSLIEWPDEPAWISAVGGENREPGDPTTRFPAFRVSDQTARVIRKGHPWIRPDDASDSGTRFRPGSLVRVISRDEEELGWARIEGGSHLAARIWARGGLSAKEIPSVEARVARAIARRRELLVEANSLCTNAFRLIHGEGDGLPGLVIDRLGPLLRVLVTGRASEEIRERVLDALHSQLPLTPEGEEWSVLELNHVRGPGPSDFDRVQWLRGGLDALAATGLQISDAGFQVLELGLLYAVDPGWKTPRRVRPGYGLFVDQRENRARLAPYAARGGEWLNLFSHSGAFSASLLAAGASRVTSVDLSAAYLKRLEENLRANRGRGVDPTRSESVRVDSRRFLETLPSRRRFAGIVLDPPTAASAGRRFWSSRRDLEPLLQQCIQHLGAGGVLLVTQNRNGPPLGLDRMLSRIVDRAGRAIERLEAARAGDDHPSLAGFPEGEPFEGWLLQLD